MAEGRDEDDREGQRLALELRRELRGTTPPPRADLVERVMREVAGQRAPRRWWAPLAWLWRPRPATALVVVGAALLVAQAAVRWSTHPPALQVASPAPAPAAAAVHFAMVAPAARFVAVAGDFNDWKPEPLTPGREGWSLDRVVPPGDWRYAFVVDGRWVEDPAASRYSPDGFGGRNAVLRL